MLFLFRARSCSLDLVPEVTDLVRHRFTVGVEVADRHARKRLVFAASQRCAPDADGRVNGYSCDVVALFCHLFFLFVVKATCAGPTPKQRGALLA